MNLGGSLHLGWAYLRRQRAKTLLLVGALTLILALPASIQVLVRQAEIHLRSRAEATPLVVGAPGSALELVFNSLYFSQPDVTTLPRREADAVGADGLATIIPIYARFAAREHRIVGTTLDYFRFRDLELADGTLMIRLGDCVLGSEVAAREELGPGGWLVSTPEAVFDLAGVYPLKMRVAGILAPTGTADDRAIFVDAKTAWVIEGLAHGHQDARELDDSQLLPRGEDDEGAGLRLNASVVEYTEITDENVDSFHFHGDPGDFPLTGAIVVPRDDKARTILLGRHQSVEQAGLRLVQPAVVMEELFETVFQIQRFVVISLLLVGVAALSIALLVFLLSNRLRRREFASLGQIGADPSTVRLLVAFEGLFVLAASALFASAIVAGLQIVAPSLARFFTGG